MLWYIIAPLKRCGTEGTAGERGGARPCADRGGARLITVAPQDGDTPLHCAAFCGHPVVMEKLLAAGAAKDAPNKVRG